MPKICSMMSHRSIQCSLAASMACSIAMTSFGFAQIAPPTSAQAAATPSTIDILKDRPDRPAQSALLGGHFESAAAGISFHTPIDCRQVRGNGEEIARFIDEKKSWELVAAKTVTKEPLPLTAAEKFKSSGLLEIVVSQIRNSNPGAEILREDVTNVNQSKAALIAARLTVGTQRKLLQQVIIQSSDRLYYTIALTSPAGKKPTDESEADPGEKLAVDTFSELVDSIKLMDLAAVRADQDERLFRTRAFYVSLTPARIKQALVPEQWLRLVRDGKDVGYTYIIEEADAQGASQGVKVGVRSRTMPDANTQVDGETWYFVSFDRRHETWSNLAAAEDRKTANKSNMSEIGASDAITKNVLNNNLQIGVANDPRQPAVEAIDLYDLTVTKAGKQTNSAPLKMRLPPYYLPQALGHLLPRLVPLNAPKTYMFYTYVSEQGRVMARYVDVGREQSVTLAGQKLNAIPITDRIGLEGSAIIHYMSPQGKYLGSLNADTQLTILPSDGDALQKIWANNINLTRPAVPDQPAK